MKVALEPGEAVIPLNRLPCSHRQAEPVVLSTGELVACVCIACLAALSADWIDNQRERAVRIAYCDHGDQIEITQFGQAVRQYLCNGCGELK